MITLLTKISKSILHSYRPRSLPKPSDWGSSRVARSVLFPDVAETQRCRQPIDQLVQQARKFIVPFLTEYRIIVLLEGGIDFFPVRCFERLPGARQDFVFFQKKKLRWLLSCLKTILRKRQVLFPDPLLKVGVATITLAVLKTDAFWSITQRLGKEEESSKQKFPSVCVCLLRTLSVRASFSFSHPL